MLTTPAPQGAAGAEGSGSAPHSPRLGQESRLLFLRVSRDRARRPLSSHWGTDASSSSPYPLCAGAGVGWGQGRGAAGRPLLINPELPLSTFKQKDDSHLVFFHFCEQGKEKKEIP